jgi:GGDEF domain-containing protein
MAMRALSHALLSWTRIEDSVFRLDATTFGILLAGDTVDAARSFVERASGLLANTEVHEDGHPVFLEVLGGVAAWSGDMNSLSDLIDAARADLRSPGDGWTPGQYTRWDEPE